MEDARKLLDSLMGGHRNEDKKVVAKKKGRMFLEDTVCKNYLIGFCPQHEDLFASTKRHLGECTKLHSEAMKEEFEKHPDSDKYRGEYERKLKQYLEELVRIADDWVARERRNIEAANRQLAEDGPNEAAKAKIQELNDQASALLLQAEEEAEKGNMGQSKAKVELAADFKRRAADFEEKARVERSDDICPVCGSRMESGDPSVAKFQHTQGKIHIGYVKIREWLADLRKKVKERDEREAKDHASRRTSRRDRSRSRDRGRENRDRPRDRDRDRERDQRDPPQGGRDRDRDRDRDQRARAGGGTDRGEEVGGGAAGAGGSQALPPPASKSGDRASPSAGSGRRGGGGGGTRLDGRHGREGAAEDGGVRDRRGGDDACDGGGGGTRDRRGGEGGRSRRRGGGGGDEDWNGGGRRGDIDREGGRGSRERRGDEDRGGGGRNGGGGGLRTVEAPRGRGDSRGRDDSPPCRGGGGGGGGGGERFERGRDRGRRRH